MNFRNLRNRITNTPQKKPTKKCKIKIKKDTSGKISGYESENCTKEEIKAFMGLEQEG